MTDITPAIEAFISGVLNCFGIIYDTLDSISFYGISLLDFFITVFVISVVLPLILTLLRSRSVESRSEEKRGSGD